MSKRGFLNDICQNSLFIKKEMSNLTSSFINFCIFLFVCWSIYRDKRSNIICDPRVSI